MRFVIFAVEEDDGGNVRCQCENGRSLGYCVGCLKLGLKWSWHRNFMSGFAGGSAAASRPQWTSLVALCALLPTDETSNSDSLPTTQFLVCLNYQAKELLALIQCSQSYPTTTFLPQIYNHAHPVTSCFGGIALCSFR